MPGEIVPYGAAAPIRLPLPKAKSAVAGILSPDGGLRTVVTQRWRMHEHLRRGERLFVVPDLLVEEPMPFNSALMAHCIRMVHVTVSKSLAPKNPCGECRQCCITPYLSDPDYLGRGIKKASHTVCPNCDKETGCLVQYHKPAPCRKFECLWLKSRDKNWIMPDELRPDRCGIIFTGPEKGDPEDLIYLHPNAHDPEAHDREPVTRWVDAIQAEGHRVKMVTHYHDEKVA